MSCNNGRYPQQRHGRAKQPHALMYAGNNNTIQEDELQTSWCGLSAGCADGDALHPGRSQVTYHHTTSTHQK